MAHPTQKYRIIRDILLRDIRSGVYPPGAQLPAERELAARHEVSHMTARRAVSELVEDNWLERRPPLGTFVRQNRITVRCFNVICSGLEHPLQRQFIAQCVQQIEARGDHAKIVHFGVNDEYAAPEESGGADLSEFKYHEWRRDQSELARAY